MTPSRTSEPLVRAVPARERRAERPHTARGLSHIPALDGLRGVAVVGVLAFHLGHLRGGYLGVDLFFVLSGFLITSLLLVERDATGRIDLRAFWARRARRLLPALFLLIGAAALYAATDPSGLDAGRFRRDALATLGYVANWQSITADHGYWDLFARPSLLAHSWSLAIEEQLYVVWPLVVTVIIRWGRRPLAVATGLLALASVVTMALVHAEGGDTTRAYFGTDTRAAAVLFGALVALWRPSARWLSVLGLVAAAALAVAWATVDGTTSWLYEGGFALCSVAAAVVIASIAAQRGPLVRALELAPLRHLGLISYGVYLWHWPVFVVLTPEETGAHGWPLLVLRLAVTLGIAELSYWLLELPIRRGSLRGWRVRLAAPAAAGTAVVAVLAGTVATAPASVEPAPVPPAPTPVAAPAEPGVERVLVVGDSGAAFLGDGLVRAAPDHDVEVRNAGTIACGLLASEGGRLRLDDGRIVDDPEWCLDWPERWRAELDAFEPDTALLVIGWPGLGDREIDGEWRHPCDPVFDAHHAARVRAALDVLGSSGARVVIAASPYLTLPVAQSDHVERVDCLNATYRAEASAAGADVLELGEWLCAGERARCRLEEDGVTLRPDGVHFRDEGAVIAAEWTLRQLLRDPGEEQRAEDRERGG